MKKFLLALALVCLPRAGFANDTQAQSGTDSGGNKSPYTLHATTVTAQDGDYIALGGAASIGVAVTITGAATLTPEVSLDNVTWLTLGGKNANTQAAVSSVTTTGAYTFDGTGWTFFRMRSSAVSGIVTVSAQTAPNSGAAVAAGVTSSSSSGGLTDDQLRATPVPISGTVTSTPSGTQAVSNAGLSNIDVLLSTRTKPSDQQHALLDSGSTTTVTQGTGTNLHTVVDSAPTTAVTNAGLSNIDVALSTRLKPADTLAAVTTVGTITNPVTVTGTVSTTPPANASTNVAQFGGTNVSTGTGTGGAGIPRVTVSSDSTVTANAGTNLNTSLLALDSTVAKDATLTGGTQKAIVRGGAKGATAAADVTSTANGADHQALDAMLQSGSTTTVTQGTGTNLHTVVDSAPTTAVTNAGLSNLDVLLSTRTKPADQQHGIVDSSALPSGASTSAAQTDRTQKTQLTDGTRDGTVKAGSTLPALSDTAIVTTQRDPLPAGTNVLGHVIVDTAPSTAVTNAGLSNIDVALSTRLKPADTLAGVTTVGAVTSITNTVTAAGAKTSNNAAPGATNLGVLPLLANAAAPTLVEGNMATVSGDLKGNTRVTQSDSGLRTYHASGSFTVAATATDVVTVCGAAATTVKIWRLQISATETTATSLAAWTLVKRSAADTTGTFVAATRVPMDAGDAAAAATVGHYTANPGALGAAVGTIWNGFYMLPAPTTAINPPTVIDYSPNDRDLPFIKPVTLTAAAQCFCLNLGGGALPAGLSAMKYDITWTEQ